MAEDILEEPLLHESTEDELSKQQETARGKLKELDVHYTALLQGMAAQGKLAWPVVLQFIANYAISVISLAFVGHLGKTELAAAAMGSSFVNILARTVIMGLCGALDTQASQAYGAGNLPELGQIFQRTVVFLWVHALPLTALLLAAPRLLARKEGDEALAEMAMRFLVYLMPVVWLDCVARPLNRILVSQRITRPQMVVSLVIVPLHVATNWFFIHKLGMGYVGAAAALVAATIYNILLTAAYVWGAGLSPHVWGVLTLRMFQGWREFAKLAYPACLMRVAESLGFSLMTLLAGLLPDPETAVAAISVAFNIYGILYMGFSAVGITASAMVGNALGLGDGLKAKVASLSALAWGPVLWVFVAILLVEPHTQAALMAVFTDGSDPQLLLHLQRLLYIVVLLELMDGLQCIMTGVITGAGKQRYGAVINLVAFYVVAIPTAIALGFWAHMGIEGMYLGMVLGPLTQAICYAYIIANTRWSEEAAAAADKQRARTGTQSSTVAVHVRAGHATAAPAGNAAATASRR